MRPSCRPSPAPPATVRRRSRARENAPDARTGMRAWASFSLREVIVGVRQPRKGNPGRVANGQSGCVDDDSDAMQRQGKLGRGRGDALIGGWRGSETQFVIVAPREQALERDVVCRARELPVERFRTRNRRQLDRRAYLGRFKDMPEVADQTIGDVDCGGCQTAQVYA